MICMRKFYRDEIPEVLIGPEEWPPIEDEHSVDSERVSTVLMYAEDHIDQDQSSDTM
jgi:hypothetical protein